MIPYFFARLNQHRSGAVAEQHAGRTVGIVDDRRHLVCSDQHDLAVFAGLDELRSDGERIDEAGARGLHVEAADAVDARHVADEIGRRGEYEVRRRRGADQEVHLAGSGAGLLEESAHRFRAHMRSAQSLALEDVPLFDAGALDDPLVTGVDHLRELGVGKHVGRHVAEHAGDSRAHGGVARSRLCPAGLFRAFRHAHAPWLNGPQSSAGATGLPGRETARSPARVLARRKSRAKENKRGKRGSLKANSDRAGRRFG